MGADLDLFVVNSFGSASQALFVFALLPMLATVRGMAMADVPAYLAQGWQCFQGITPACGGDCSGAPLLPLAYVTMNLYFNVSVLHLIRQAGNVVISLVMSAMLPATLLAFTLPLPFLEPSPPLGPAFLLGTVVLMGGLVAYNAPMWTPTLKTYLAEARRGPRRGEWGGGSGGGGDGGPAPKSRSL